MRQTTKKSLKSKFKHNVISIFMAILFVFSINIPALANDDIKVVVDNVQLNFDVQPQFVNGRTMVPLRAIFEALGATVYWDGETQTITAYNDKSSLRATIGQKLMIVNGNSMQMDVAPMIINGRTLVPVRFVSEAFDCDVEWFSPSKTVDIRTKNTVNSPNTDMQTYDSESINHSSNTTDDTQTVFHNEYSFEPTRKLKIKCTNVIRGNQANAIIKEENMFNDEPSSNQEWMILEFNVQYLSSTDGNSDEIQASDIIYKDTFYNSSHSSIPVYDMATLGDRYGAYGVFDVNMFPGSSSKIVIGLLTDKNIGEVLLKVPNKNGGNLSWINCTEKNGTYVQNDSVNNSTSASINDNKSYVGYSYYPGTTIPTYTSVTGVSLKSQKSLSGGEPLYIYRYTDSDDVGSYWSKLFSSGWTEYKGDDRSTSDVFESSFVKGSDFLILYVCLDLDEVWITY